MGAIGNLPYVKQVDRTSTNGIKDPDVVCAHVFPNAELPIVKEVNWHEFGRVGTEFCVICVLEHISSSARAVTKEQRSYPYWQQRPILQYLQFSTNAHAIIKDGPSCILNTCGILCIIPSLTSPFAVTIFANVRHLV